MDLIGPPGTACFPPGPMKGASAVIFLALFGFCLLVAFIALTSARTPNLPKVQLVINEVLHVGGYLLALSGGIGLMLAAIRGGGEQREATAGYALALLGGVLIVNPNWGVAVAIAVIVAAHTVHMPFRRPALPEGGREQGEADS